MKSSLLFVLAVPVLAAASAGDDFVAYMRGNATLNGNAVSAESVHLSSGDVINTNGGAVYINATGSTVNLPRNTSAMVRDGVLRIGCGSASVVTRSGLTTHVGGVDIKPLSNNAQYTVVTRDGELTISALRGAERITSGGKSMVLGPGKGLKLSSVCNNNPSEEGELVFAALGEKLGETTPLGTGSYTSPIALAVIGAGTAAVVATTIIAINASSNGG